MAGYAARAGQTDEPRISTERPLRWFPSRRPLLSTPTRGLSFAETVRIKTRGETPVRSCISWFRARSTTSESGLSRAEYCESVILPDSGVGPERPHAVELLGTSQAGRRLCRHGARVLEGRRARSGVGHRCSRRFIAAPARNDPITPRLRDGVSPPCWRSQSHEDRSRKCNAGRHRPGAVAPGAPVARAARGRGDGPGRIGRGAQVAAFPAFRSRSPCSWHFFRGLLGCAQTGTRTLAGDE